MKFNFTSKEKTDVMALIISACKILKLPRQSRRKFMRIARKFKGKGEIKLKQEDRRVIFDLLSFNVSAIEEAMSQMSIPNEYDYDKCAEAHTSYARLYEKFAGGNL